VSGSRMKAAGHSMAKDLLGKRCANCSLKQRRANHKDEYKLA
jgi:hypothetical protein